MKTNIKQSAWGLCLALLIGAVGCEADEEYSGGDDATCGQGTAVGQGDDTLCVYQGTLIIEGFDCPPELPLRMDFDAFVACGPQGGFPQGYEDQLRDRGFEPRDLPPGEPGGECGRDGARVPAEDGCNTCSCLDGAWACTEIACADNNGNTGNNGANNGPLACGDGGSFPADDGCNTCTCFMEGDFVGASCTEIGCPQQCEDGDTMQAENNCDCVCANGWWSCDPVGCLNTACEPGVVLPAGDGCNTCSCLDGVWACTLSSCQ